MLYIQMRPHQLQFLQDSHNWLFDGGWEETINFN